MLEITFLGTVAGIPTPERNHPAIMFEYHSYRKHNLLFDCGEGTQLQLMKAGISFMQIDKIFITHWHADHFSGLIPLLQTMNMEGRKRELTVFAPDSKKFITNILKLGYFGLRFPLKTVDVNYKKSEITKIYETKEFEILSIPVVHTIPSVAFCFKEKDRWSIDIRKLKQMGLKRGKWLKELKEKGEAVYRGKKIKIEDVANKKPGIKVVYTGDTTPCENVVKLAKNADVLIHDGTFYDEKDAEDKYHSTVVDAAKIAKKANVKYLILTHISRKYQKDDVKKLEEAAREVFPNSFVAKDFMKVIIKRGKVEIK